MPHEHARDGAGLFRYAARAVDRAAKVDRWIPLRVSCHYGVSEEVPAFGAHAMRRLVPAALLDALEDLQHIERLDACYGAL